MSNLVIPITVTITTCNRLDLLKKTLDSFFAFNTYPVSEFLMTDDSGDKDITSILQELYGNKFKIFANTPKLGLSASLDILFSNSTNEYIFHLEDDWMFDRGGFIEDSLLILESRKDIHQVWVRHQYDLHHKCNEDMSIPELHNWNGYSWNPGLRRKSDYIKMFPNGLKEFREEFACMQHTKKFDYKVVSLLNTSCYHIGYNRHTDNFTP